MIIVEPQNQAERAAAWRIVGASWRKAKMRFEFPSSPITLEAIESSGLPHAVTGGVLERSWLLGARLVQKEFARADDEMLAQLVASKYEQLLTDTLVPHRQHQLAALSYPLQIPGSLLWHGMGSGKTKVIVSFIHLMATLLNPSLGRWALISTPKPVIPHWKDQLDLHRLGSNRVHYLVLDHGSTKMKAEVVKKVLQQTASSQRPLVVVGNYESLWREPLASALTDFRPPYLVVADEIQKIKAPGGKASRFFAKLGRIAKRRVGLSGTPCPHSPLDAYGVFRFLDAGIFGVNFTRFRSRYAIMGGYENREVIQWTNEEDYNRRFHSITHRVRTEDVIELTETSDIEIKVLLAGKLAKHYKTLRDELFLNLEDQGWATVENSLVKLLRLQQLTSGYLPKGTLSDQEELLRLDTGKADALKSMLESIELAKEPVVVFCRFREDLNEVHRVCDSLGATSWELSGRTNQLPEWKHSCSLVEGTPAILAAQIQAGGVGVEMIEARYCVFFSMGFSLGDYLQARARVHRQGQERKVFYYHLIRPGTVDVTVYAALRRRQEVLDYMLENRRI